MNRSKIKQQTSDILLSLTIATLVIAGIVMVFSSSAVYAMQEYQDSYYFLKRHLLWVLLGTGILLWARHTDYHNWQKFNYPILIVSLTLLILVIVPGWSKEVGGARRWLNIFGFTFQPSELAKFAIVLFIAHSMVKRSSKLKNFTYGYLPNLIVLGIFFILILFQPDFGTAMIISAVSFSMFFIAGIRKKFLFISVLAVLPFLISAVWGTEYRARRLLSFLDPWSDAGNSGFQAVQSFLAFGRGGIWGLGLGDSKQKLFYLPEAHTDFIFSVIGEELGFIGSLVIITLFALLIWRGLSTAFRAKDLFGTHLAFGLTFTVGIQALINMGVAVGILPTKGLTLPFISLGGSSLLITMASMGVLLNISENTIRS